MVSILLSATLSFRITQLSAINFELMWGSFIYFPKAWRMASCSVTPSSYSFFFSGQSYLRWEWARKNNTIPDQVTMWNNLPSHSISRIELYPRVTMYLKKDSWFVSYSWFLIATYHHRWLQFSDWFWIRTVKREREKNEDQLSKLVMIGSLGSLFHDVLVCHCSHPKLIIHKLGWTSNPQEKKAFYPLWILHLDRKFHLISWWEHPTWQVHWKGFVDRTILVNLYLEESCRLHLSSCSCSPSLSQDHAYEPHGPIQHQKTTATTIPNFLLM